MFLCWENIFRSGGCAHESRKERTSFSEVPPHIRSRATRAAHAPTRGSDGTLHSDGEGWLRCGVVGFKQTGYFSRVITRWQQCREESFAKATRRFERT
jgi:hypothetical protein